MVNNGIIEVVFNNFWYFFVKKEYKYSINLIEILVFKKNKVILPSKITSLPKRCAQKATFQTRIGHRKQPMYYVGYMQQRGTNIITEQKYKEAIAACDSREYIEYNISH